MRFSLATIATAALIFSASAAPHGGHGKGRNSTDTEEQGSKGVARGRFTDGTFLSGADLSTASVKLSSTAGKSVSVSKAKSDDSKSSDSSDSSSDSSDSGEASSSASESKDKKSKDKTSSGSGDKETSSSSGDKETSSSSGDEETSSGSGDKETSSGSGDEETSSGSGDKETSSGSGDKETSSGAGDEETSSGSGNEETSSGAGDEETSSGSGDEETSSGSGSGSGSGGSSSGGSSSGGSSSGGSSSGGSSNSTAPSTPSSGGSAASGTFPTAAGESTLSAPMEVTDFDGGMVKFGRGVSCSSGEGGDTDAVFIVAEGGSLSNVIIGADQIEGVHCLGACTIKNVWWEAVCEDALSFKGNGDGTVSGGGAKGAQDKVIQHNGVGTITISGFMVEDFGKLYRSCGNCKTQGERHVKIDGVKATGGSAGLVGINSNFGDTATITNSCIAATEIICEEFQGTSPGNEPKKISNGPSSACIYTDADISAC